MSPLISVVMPCFNHAPYLEAMLESVWAQDYPSVEIVLCDDASTDNSAELAEALAKRSPYPMTVLRHQTNQGAPKTSRAAAKASRGEYVVFFSSDDIMAPGRLAWQADYLATQLQCDIVYGDGHRFDSADPERTMPLYLNATLSLFQKPVPVVLEQLYTQSSPFFIQSAMVRTEAYRECIETFSDDMLADDWVLTLRLFERMARLGHDFAFYPRPAFYYRLHGNGELGNLHHNLPKQTQAKKQVFETLTPPAKRPHALATMYWAHYRRALETKQYSLAWSYLLSSLRYGPHVGRAIKHIPMLALRSLRPAPHA